MRMLLIKANNIQPPAQRAKVLRDLVQLDRVVLERLQELGRRLAGYRRQNSRQRSRPAGGVGATVRGAEEHDTVRVCRDVGEVVVFGVFEGLRECVSVGGWWW